MLNEPEIQAIIDEHNTGAIGFSTDVEAAAEAIAAQLTPVHRMSEFIWQMNGTEVRPQYIVTQPGGERYQVDTMSPGRFRCTPVYNEQRWCTPDEMCPHVQAVELHLARQEATC